MHKAPMTDGDPTRTLAAIHERLDDGAREFKRIGDEVKRHVEECSKEKRKAEGRLASVESEVRALNLTVGRLQTAL